MNIPTTKALIKTSYSGYTVKPFKWADETKPFSYQIDNEEEADLWGVMSLKGEEQCELISNFEDQDEAHQFAELLTICLNQIKAFQNENIQTETK